MPNAGPERDDVSPEATGGAVAVIGMACRFPGAEGYEAFWENLRQGRCEVREIPPDRWDWRRYWGDPQAEPGKSNSRWGSFLDRVDTFDAAFFSVSPRDAEILDPQQRIMLELAWSCFEDAGLPPSRAWGTKTGVFVGSAILDYKELLEQEGLIDAQYAAAVAHSVIAARVSHAFNLRGPSVPMDTACASSLYAIHLAVRSLQRGECAMAFAGGINVLLTPLRYISFAKMGILSPTGRCRSFDDAADGTVRGEGAGLLLLKRLEDAVRDGDPIHGVIKGSAVNHSGRTHTLSYPNPVAQAEVIRDAWRDAGIGPETVTYVEAHGTGTPKGDPLEFEGLRQAFGPPAEPGAGRAEPWCGISSVKSNLGHLESAAGIAGVVKVLLAMQREQLPGLQGFERLNHRITAEGTPFYFVDRLRPWRRLEAAGGGAVPLRAGVSSFGFAGTNAHVVLEEAPPPAPRPAAAPLAATGHLMCLSAKTPEALRRVAADLGSWLEGPGAKVGLAELGAALLSAREWLPARAAFVAGSQAELRARLAAVAAGAPAEGVSTGVVAAGQAAPPPERAEAAIAEWRSGAGGPEQARRAKADALGALFVEGAALDVGRLTDQAPVRDLRLPTYPFARERHWIPARERAGLPRPAGDRLHPLVHANTSDLGQQRFSSTFDGREPFFADHRVDGGVMLPGAAYLVMACAAAARSIVGARAAPVSLRDAVFARPMRVGEGERRVEIALTPGREGEADFAISSTAAADGEPVVHCHGRAALAAAGEATAIDLHGVRAACGARTFGREACYGQLSQLGFDYGPSHRRLSSVSLGDGQALARLTSPEDPPREGGAPEVGLLDAALQVCLMLMAHGRGGLVADTQPLPYAVGLVEGLGAVQAAVLVHVRERPVQGEPGEMRSFDLDLCDERGGVQVRLRDFAVRLAARRSAEGATRGRLLARPYWLEQPASGNPGVLGPAERLVLLCEPVPGAVEQVTSAMRGARCVGLHGVGEPAERALQACGIAFEEIRRLLAARPGAALVQAVFSGGGAQRLHAAIGGLLRSAARENPALRTQLIELGGPVDGPGAATALAECAQTPEEGVVRYQAGVRSVERWREVDQGVDARSPWKDGGVYLISGGAGGLGLVFAAAIAGAAKGAVVYLAGRSELTDAKAAQLRSLEALGCRAVYARVDVSRRAEVDALVARILREQGRLDGVVHGAGVLRDGFVIRKERAELEEVLAAKARGAWNLDEATRGLALDFFVCFSSVAGVLGNAGQADYAAANAFLDAYAVHRRELAASGLRQGRSLSVAWPLWREGGMQVGPEHERALEEAFGMQPIASRDGVEVLRRALSAGAERVLYVEGDLGRFREALGPARPGAPVSAPGRERQARGATGTPMTASLADAIAFTQREMSLVLKTAPSRMDPAAPMESHGIDSVVIMQLTRQLERTLGSLPKTLFFEYRSIRELAQHLLEAHGEALQAALGRQAGSEAPGRSTGPDESQRLAPTRSARRFTAQPRAAAPRDDGGGIAIIGLSGRYPGARTLQEFWANLRDGKDCITTIPPSRWDHSLYFDADKDRPGRTYSRWGGFIDGIDEFDPLFFSISPREAELMDPQERLFLQCAYEALQDAGYTREGLNRLAADTGRGGVGVYVGVMWEEYALYGAQEQARGRNIALSGSPASIANRVSYFCDFKGPSLAVDTLCSSSLTAVHLACQSLRRGECAAAVAGGVNLSIHPNKYLWLAAGRYVSSKGRCESFGEGGDGYVPGEGVGAVLLKPLARAEADGDRIYGVIRGSAVNHGGKANGFTVPSPAAQARVIGEALEDAGVDARAVSYIEAHGTGTSLGDPIEIAGLTQAFEAAGVSGRGECAIGSAKSNIGHCEGAAGVAGLSKVLLQMKHRQLVPSLHSSRLNANIDFGRTPFFVQQELAAWERPAIMVGGARVEQPRIAGISAFGAGGSNAHLIVQEHEAARVEPAGDGASSPVAILLSARDEAALLATARRLLDALRGTELGGARLADVAYTLQVGREAMEERLGILASSIEELALRLEAFLGGEPDEDVTFRGRASAGGKLAELGLDEDMARALEAWFQKRKLGKLLSLWVDGVPVDWSKLSWATAPRRIGLPTYPFARERYWVPTAEAAVQGASVSRPATLHPLLHENTSDLDGQRYTSRFTGDEFFLRDHVVAGRKVLPGAAQLELARAAVVLAAGARAASAHVRIEDVVWSAPVQVDDAPVQVSIALAPQEGGAVEFEIRSGDPQADAARRVHCRGRARLMPRGDAEQVDLQGVEARCSARTLTGAECYTTFHERGIDYGAAHRGIERVLVGRDEALVSLRLPAEGEGAGWGLHPSILDSAMQGAIGLIEDGDGPAPLPFMVEALDVVAGTGAAMWAHLRRASDAGAGEATSAFDIDLCDPAGKVCARVHGLRLRGAGPRGSLRTAADQSAGTLQEALLAPVWDPVAEGALATLERTADRVLIVGASDAWTEALRRSHPDATFLEIRAGASVEAIEARCEGLGELGSVIWVAPEADAQGSWLADALARQELGALHLFRLVKALLRRGYGGKTLAWTIVTSRCVQVRATDPVDPTNAGVHGLVSAMALEHPGWRVRLVDLDGERTDAADLADALAAVPWAPDGKAWALRDGIWHRQRLVRVARSTPTPSPYQRGATYVVVGGAGGLGEVWTEHVVRECQARVIWIGRRPPDGEIDRKIERLSRLGPAPRYVQADASSLDDLRRAYRAIRAEHPRVDGLVHSAIVLADKGLAGMDEATFRVAYDAKVDTCARMAEVFGQEPLRFALFFSSAQALLGNAGQSNYAAGCTFEDAFARRLAQAWSCPVKVMNWGYWGEHGIVATAAHRERMARAGFGSIGPDEGLAALDELLASPLPQLAFLKASRARMEAIGAEEALTVYGETAPAVAGALPDLEAGPGAAIAAQAGAQAAEEEALLGDLLRVQLESAGVDWRSPRAAPPSARCPPLCRRWLEVSARILAAQRIEPDALDPWRRWEQAKRGWLVDAGRRARVELAERALRAIPDVLNGRVKATEVLFPGARFELVEGIYRGNAVADYFNAAAAEQVAAYVEARLRHDPQARLRILEVGAGTGSTSAAVLARLEPYAPRLEEYRFTDVSRAFLLRAEAELAPGRPFLRASVFDVGAPVAAQGIEPARYDVAIATSVLHATDDVRRSLRNVKAALRRNGVLVLNELSTTSLFLHVTFGLLEGWWSHLDTPLRIPGSPVLTPEAWRRALEREGFGDVRFPVSAAHGAGQQIVTAASDGVVRQPIPGRAGPAVPAAAARPAATAAPKRPPRPAGGAASGQDRLRERGRAYLKQVVGEVLKVPVERIETSAPLGRYGIDSILIVRLAAALRGVFGEVSTTLLFEHQSIDALVEEFLRTRPGAFAALADAPDAGQPGAGEAPRPPREAVSAPGPVDEPFGRRARAVGGAARRAAPEGGQEGRGREVAIVGLAGRYPRSPDVRAFWRNLREGRSCVSEVPRDRWDWRAYHGDAKGTWGTIYTRWGGFLDDVARFDPAFFHLSPREAAQIDPQERQFLEIAYAAIEDAGYVPAGLSAGGKVGVFVGVTNGHYGSGAAHWSVANRVSFALDFHGPSLAVDTACSSSLTAIHLAVESLRSGTCDCAIAGGVNLIVAPIHYMKLAAAGMLSPGDACRAFGAGADGFVDGEGVGAVVLKPLERALADGDQVYAVIKGSMVNAGGRTHGYTVPNPAAQQAVVAEALRRAGVAARGVSYLEAHGTGTELGDPIEIAGLSRAFAAETGDRGFCAIGSVKGNIGHLESAAGIAGLTKVLLQMKHGQVAPSLHAALPNPKIDFADTPFVVQQALATWRRPRLTVDGEVRTIPLIAGISSFGAGGANAHLVVQELNRPDRAASARGGVGAFVLSARTERDLRAKARQLADFVEAGELGEERLLDAAFTLQVGREPMAERLGLVVTSLQELGEKLAAFSETGESPRGTFRGSVSGREPQRQGDVVETGVPATIPEWERLVEAWVAGAAVDWRRASGARDRVSLPTYPFAGDRYWAPAERSQVAPRLPGSGAVVVASPEGTPPGASRQPQPAADAGSGAPADPARDGGAACDRGPAGRALRAELAESLAKILELRSGDIDVDQEFADMGLDSIIGVEWIRALGAHYGISIRPTAVYDYPSIRAFAGFLEKELVRARPGGPPAEPRVEPRVEPAPGSSESALRDMLLQVKQGTLDVEVADRLVAAIVGCEAQTADGAG